MELGIIIDDDPKLSAGKKFNKWELQGIPLRIEIGPKEAENNIVTVVRRDNNKKEIVPMKKITTRIPEILEEMQNDMFNKAKSWLDSKIKVCDSLSEFERAFEAKSWSLVRWCGGIECEEGIKEKYGAKSNNIPFEQPKKATGKCVFCESEAKYYAFIARSH